MSVRLATSVPFANQLIDKDRNQYHNQVNHRKPPPTGEPMTTEMDQPMSMTMSVDDALNSAQALLDRAKDLGAVKSGEFTLSSGKKSNLYFDGRLLSVDPQSVGIIFPTFFERFELQKSAIFWRPRRWCSSDPRWIGSACTSTEKRFCRLFCAWRIQATWNVQAN